MSAEDNYEQVLDWLEQWVNTGEQRLNEEDYDQPRWEVYAGWLEVNQMPECVRSILATGLDYAVD